MSERDDPCLIAIGQTTDRCVGSGVEESIYTRATAGSKLTHSPALLPPPSVFPLPPPLAAAAAPLTRLPKSSGSMLAARAPAGSIGTYSKGWCRGREWQCTCGAPQPPLAREREVRTAEPGTETSDMPS